MAVKWLDERTFQIDLEMIEPPDDCTYLICEPIEFMAKIDKGEIPLQFVSQVTLRLNRETNQITEIDRVGREATRTERKAYLAAYQQFSREGDPSARRIFFVMPPGMGIVEGQIVFIKDFIQKGENNA
jgi:hypothetical protein